MKRLKIDLDTPQWRGQWALVTGASSGIGRAFCQQLAAKGLNIALLARRADRLKALASKLEQTHGVRTWLAVCDLSQPTAVTELRRQLDAADIRIRMLVNNAAFGRWGRFEEQPATLYQDMLQVDVIAPSLLCIELRPHLASHPDAAVIMVSSPAALQPVPYMAVYAAAKAYIHALGQALHGEWAQLGILVQTLVPGPTATEFDAVAGAYASALKGRGDPMDVVKASLRGLARGDAVVWQAKGTYQQRLFTLMPPSRVIRKVARMFEPPDHST